MSMPALIILFFPNLEYAFQSETTIPSNFILCFKLSVIKALFACIALPFIVLKEAITAPTFSRTATR